MVNIALADWNPGPLSTEIIALTDLKSLTGSPSGIPIWKSNNPEKFNGNGWLMQHARGDVRGSNRFLDLSDSFAVYLFHINDSSRDKFLHLLATNPQTSSVTLSGKGSMFNNRQFPLPAPANRRGKGLCYQVARNWLEDNHQTSFRNQTLEPGKAYQINRLRLQNRNMVDGRFEITTTAGVFIYSVVTSTGRFEDALNISQRINAPGVIASPGPAAFGREAGIYSHSLWQETITVEVPDSPAHLGLQLNTREQTTDSVIRLSDSARRTFGNYGHKYDLTIVLNNSSTSARRIRLSFASNDTSAPVGSLYNGPIRLNNQIKDILNTPTNPKDVLETFEVPANNSTNITIQFYVPGLITIGQQLILESIAD